MIRQKIAQGIGSFFNKSKSRASSDLKFDYDNVEDFIKALRQLPEDDLINLYRGESFTRQKAITKSLEDSARYFKTTLDEMKKDSLKGQWYTPNLEHAKAYAGGLLSKIKKLKVTPKELEAFYRYKDRVNKTRIKYANRKDFTHGVTPSPHHVLIPRYKLKKMPSETDYLIKEKFKGDYKEGGLAGILQI
jgi:ClpP class serine protease